ncbi:MAG TPA: hypothetical protein VN047_06620 [Sphingopyxis sp.]|jgi:hypothetical protein|uniref:hypothetical protein n=1 Tax=Sphingopyxis sp. TaxID=1908224 RepID=UPI002CC32F29|nr:hypothetical protein [Sphingopyxis sp.]HWW56548.1 hypothetical protein [Sphingopyxis sp.]
MTNLIAVQALCVGATLSEKWSEYRHGVAHFLLAVIKLHMICVRDDIDMRVGAGGADNPRGAIARQRRRDPDR